MLPPAEETKKEQGMYGLGNDLHKFSNASSESSQTRDPERASGNCSAQLDGRTAMAEGHPRSWLTSPSLLLLAT